VAVDFEPATGTLRATDHVVRVLLACMLSGRFPQPGQPGGEDLAALRAAGALNEHGEPVSSLALCLAAVLRPERTTELTVGQQTVRAWTTGPVTTLLRPLIDDPGERCELARLPTSVLPAALARLVDLGSRAGNRRHAPQPFEGEHFPAAVRRWRLATARAPVTDDDQPQQSQLTVVDTAEGFWRLDPAGHTASSITPTQLWRLLVRHTVAGAAQQPGNRPAR
jgi:hypothetical protein